MSRREVSLVRLAAIQMIRFSFELWLLAGAAAVITLLFNAPPGTSVSFFRTAVLTLTSLVAGRCYVVYLRRPVHNALSASVLGPWLVKHLDRSRIRKLTDPTASLLPIALFFALVILVIILSPRISTILALMSALGGTLIGIGLVRTFSDLYVGRRTEKEVARSLIELLSIAAGGLLLAASANIIVIPFACSIVLLTMLSWASSAYLQIAAEKLRSENSLNRDFGVAFRPSGAPLRMLNATLEVGGPVRLLAIVFYTLRRLNLLTAESERTLAKAEALFLTLLHRDTAVVDMASRYNARFIPSDPGFSRSLKNYEALAYMWQGNLSDAERIIDEIMPYFDPDNKYYEYFIYTRARIEWHANNRLEALALLNESLTRFKDRRGRDCLPGTAHKIYFLWEIGLENYFSGDLNAYEERLHEARVLLEIVQGYDKFQRTHDLIHNEANLELLKGYQPEEHISKRVGHYRTAAERLLWCLWNGAHVGARLRLALLHAIGTSDYSQAQAYLEWIDRALVTRRYGAKLPFVVRLRNLRTQLAAIALRGEVLSDGVVLLQATSDSVPELSWAIAEGAAKKDAEEARRRIFNELSVAWRPVPVSKALAIPL